MNSYKRLRDLKDNEKLWISPRSVQAIDDSISEGLLIDSECQGVARFQSYYSILIIKIDGKLLAFLTQTAMNMYRNFRYKEFTTAVHCSKVFVHPKITFNAATLIDYFKITSDQALELIEVVEHNIFTSSNLEEVGQYICETLNRHLGSLKTFVVDVPQIKSASYQIGIMPTSYMLGDRFLAVDLEGNCHLKSLSELKLLKSVG